MKWDSYLHILQFPHFTDHWNEIDRMEENFDRVWKIQKLLEILYSIFSNVYNTSKNQEAEKFIFLFKGRQFSNNVLPRNTNVLASPSLCTESLYQKVSFLCCVVYRHCITRTVSHAVFGTQSQNQGSMSCYVVQLVHWRYRSHITQDFKFSHAMYPDTLTESECSSPSWQKHPSHHHPKPTLDFVQGNGFKLNLKCDAQPATICA